MESSIVWKGVRILCCIYYTDLWKKIQQKLFGKRMVFAFFTKDANDSLSKLDELYTSGGIKCYLSGEYTGKQGGFWCETVCREHFGRRIRSKYFIKLSPDFVLQSEGRFGIMHSRRGYSSSVERQLPKLHRRVRLPLSAPTSSRTVYRSRRRFFFEIAVVHSRCRSSFQHRKRFAGLRCWIGPVSLATSHFISDRTKNAVLKRAPHF